MLVSAGLASHSRAVSWKRVVLLTCLKDDSDCYWESGLGRAKVEGGVSGRMLLDRHNYGSKR